MDIAVNSSDEQIRKISRERCEKSVMTAEELGCRGVVFHTNCIVGFNLDSYKNEWVKRCGEYYCSLAEKYLGTSYSITELISKGIIAGSESEGYTLNVSPAA